MDIKAEICPTCRTIFTAEEVKQRSTEYYKNGALGCLALIVILMVLTWLGSGENSEKQEFASVANTAEEVIAPTVAEAELPKPSGLSPAQENAVRSATQYLQMSGFSRNGLISQLSSDAGDGYAVADATAAVDSLSVNWNEQAARTASQYLKMSGFSCNGLIEQLSSSAGDQYTESQAAYGAKQAGAC